MVIQSAWFKNLVRVRIYRWIERATGGRVEIGEFSYNWQESHSRSCALRAAWYRARFRATLFRADKIQIGLRIVSALEKKVDIARSGRRGPQAVHDHQS